MHGRALEPPETRYARIDDLHIAYQVLGSGAIDILMLDQWFSHVEGQWDVAPLAAFRRRLARFGRLVMFDKRGAGLSDPIPTAELPTVETWMEDVSAVLDEVGVERAALIANLGGGVMATHFAAAHPERVSHLVLVDCFARFLEAPDYPIGQPVEAIDEAVDAIEAGAGHGHMANLFAPSYADDEPVLRAWARYERQAASPGHMKAVVRLIYACDVRSVLPAIRVPTLVIHRSDTERWPQLALGRYLAESIPNAKLVELPGDDRLIWSGNQDAIVGEIEAFLTGVRTAPEPHRVLATVMFTDIVDSTRRAAALGDERWHRLLGEFFDGARRQIDDFGGRLIDTTGDGTLSTFDGPARAVRCALGIGAVARGLGLEIRAGLPTGEIEVGTSNIAGLAVHIGARVAALAGAGEVLVSGTVRDLSVGSGLEFQDRGEHELKGVPGAWRVFEVASE
jgi:class 3 adenylate cyclase